MQPLAEISRQQSIVCTTLPQVTLSPTCPFTFVQALSSDNEWRPRSMLGISWGADHRVVDGACECVQSWQTVNLLFAMIWQLLTRSHTHFSFHTHLLSPLITCCRPGLSQQRVEAMPGGTCSPATVSALDEINLGEQFSPGVVGEATCSACPCQFCSILPRLLDLSCLHTFCCICVLLVM